MAFVDGENGENFMTEIFGLPQFDKSDTWKKQSQTDNKINDYKRIWHSGEEKPQMYKDKITGHLLSTYCLCVFWYDGWCEVLCRVTDEGNLQEVETKNIWLPSDFSYWCYTDDIMPVEIDEKYLIDISVQEGH